MKKRFLSIIAILAILALMLSACSKSSKDEAVNTERGDDYAGVTAEVTDSADTSTGNVAETNPKIIVKVNYNVETTDFDDSVDKLKSLITEMNGYCESSEIRGNTEDGGTADFILRIPSDKLDSFSDRTGEIGKILSQNRTSNDVTATYYDTENRLKSLEIQQERLLALLEKTEKLDDILQLENELTKVRTQIESLTTTLKKYDSITEYSTASIHISQVEKYTETEKEGFGKQIVSTFTGAFLAAGSVLKFILFAVIWALPYILFIALIVIIVKIRKGKKKNK